jgi:hypothetical protein
VLALVRELFPFSPQQIEGAIAWLVTHRSVDGEELVYVLDEVLEQQWDREQQQLQQQQQQLDPAAGDQ